MFSREEAGMQGKRRGWGHLKSPSSPFPGISLKGSPFGVDLWQAKSQDEKSPGRPLQGHPLGPTHYHSSDPGARDGQLVSLGSTPHSPAVAGTHEKKQKPHNLISLFWFLVCFQKARSPAHPPLAGKWVSRKWGTALTLSVGGRDPLGEVIFH